MSADATIEINGRAVALEGERNLLEVIRKANVDLPTFCYHSQLSVYGACRLCLVDVEGRGIVSSCSMAPEAGVKLKTHTPELREMRRITLELLLANHEMNCPTCPKSADCQLQALARQLGVSEVRFKRTASTKPVDRSSPFIVRDPAKCVLCGDCVRMCREIQGIGAIDFAFRGAAVAVLPAFNKTLDQVDCVGCGQCSAVCPTGALTVKSEIAEVFEALADRTATVVAQIAPAVRVALGEAYGLASGTVTTGQIAAALRALGFNRVYDTAYGADMTVLEETHEFLERKAHGAGPLPHLTSCCPAWVRMVEQHYPQWLQNLSTCKSPQQMLGAVIKAEAKAVAGIADAASEAAGPDGAARRMVVVAVMPCTAKKGEARLDKFRHDRETDVDYVITTQELIRMIDEAGIRFDRLEPESLDNPFGMKTGAALLFGASGGVSEAVLRQAAEALGAARDDLAAFQAVRGDECTREVEITVGGQALRLAVVSGLANAQALLARVEAGEAQYDLIEVMACPGGCVNGAGNPPRKERNTVAARTKGLHSADKMLDLRRSDENHHLMSLYERTIGEVGGHRAHELLHTTYQNRARIYAESFSLSEGAGGEALPVTVCVGTSCHVRGSQTLLHRLMEKVDDAGLTDTVDLRASFCHEACDRGPTVVVGDKMLHRATPDSSMEEIEAARRVQAAPKN
jgi:NADH-quinone oxidoreductase subunit G